MIKHQHRPRLLWRLFLPGILLSIALGAHAQGSSFTPVVVLRTGGGESLVSATQSLQFSSPAYLQFAFGFSTDEEPAPGSFLDSLTLTLQDAAGTDGVIYSTTDRTGTYWAPEAPGMIVISSNSIGREPTVFPALAPEHKHQFAYLVTAPVPAELLGQPLNFYADLFDNQDGTDSLAWMSSVTVVPEPSHWLLAVVGLFLFFGFRWRTE